MSDDLYRYRIERLAVNAEADQWLVNIWRRICGRPVLKAGRERYVEVMESFEFSPGDVEYFQELRKWENGVK